MKKNRIALILLVLISSIQLCAKEVGVNQELWLALNSGDVNAIEKGFRLQNAFNALKIIMTDPELSTEAVPYLVEKIIQIGGLSAPDVKFLFNEKQKPEYESWKELPSYRELSGAKQALWSDAMDQLYTIYYADGDTVKNKNLRQAIRDYYYLNFFLRPRNKKARMEFVEMVKSKL